VEVAELRARLSRNDAKLAELEAFRAVSMSRLAAQHAEIVALRQDLQAAERPKVHLLPTRQN
jgi:hypothetical protein